MPAEVTHAASLHNPPLLFSAVSMVERNWSPEASVGDALSDSH